MNAADETAAVEQRKDPQPQLSPITPPQNLSAAIASGLLLLYLFLGVISVFFTELQFFSTPRLFHPAVLSMFAAALISRKQPRWGSTCLLVSMTGYIIYVSLILPDLVDPLLFLLAVNFPLVLIPPLGLPPVSALVMTVGLIFYMAAFTWWAKLEEPFLVVFPAIFCILTGTIVWHLTRTSRRTRVRETALTQTLQRLYHFATVSSRTADFETALQATLAVLAETFPDSRTGIMLADESGENLVIRASTGYPSGTADGYTISIRAGVTGWSFRTGESVRIGAVHEDPRYFSIDSSVHSEMCVPLRDGSRTVGVINLESTERMAYSQEEQHFLETLAPQLSSLIINARLQREAKMFAELNQTLLETSPAGFIIYRENGQCVFCNETMLKILGRPEAEVLQENLYDSGFWAEIGLNASARTALKSFRFQKIDFALPQWNGEQVVEYYLQPFRLQGEPHLQVMAVDNTEHARMQRALEDERNFVATILDHAGALVMVVDHRGIVWRFNTACEQLSGMPAAEVIGRHVNEILRADSPPPIDIDRLIHSIGNQNTLEYTAPWILQDGSERLVSWVNTVILDEDNALDYVVAVGKDITEQQAVADQLRLQSEALISAANGIVITDVQGNIEWVNPAVCRMTGYEAEEMLGENPRILASGEHDNAFYADLWATIVDGRVWHGRLSNIRKDGSIYVEEMTITPVRDELGVVRHFVAIKRDITEQQHMEQALRESEARFRAFITGASVGMFVGDHQGHFIEANEALAVMCGYTVEELSRLSMINVIHPGDEEQAIELYEEFLKGNQAQAYVNLRVIRKNGQVLWTRIGMGLIRSAQGDPVYVIGIVEDVSEKHWAEEALEESERRLEQISNSVDQCIYSFAINPDGTLASPLITPSISRFSGYNVEAHLTNPDLWLEVIHPEDRGRVRDKYEPGSAHDERVYLNYRVVDRNGTVHWIKDDVHFLFSDSGRPVLMEGVLTDITALKNAQAALEEQIQIVEEANIRLRELDRLKSNFLANVSHELRTPLNSIIGFAELLVDGLAGEMNDQQLDFISDIHSSGKHLLSLINDILDLSKIEAGRLEIHPEPFKFIELAAETEASITHLFQQKQQTLRFEIADNLPELNADRIRIKQVLLNLLSNAHKFTLGNGLITLQAGLLDESAILVSVSDTGIGIAEEDFDSVFKEFQQVDSSATREIQGTGLGIPISKRIIEKHGGRLWVESILGEGTTFSFILPLAGPSAPPAVVPESTPAPGSPAGRKPLIMVIEDDRRYANILSFHFNLEGFEVAHIYRGEGALAQALDLAPCLITLDLMLPDLDGWELLKLLKSTGGTANVPVAVLSALDEREAGWGRWREYGAVAHLVKPVQHEDIRSLLESFELVPARQRLKLISDDSGSETAILRILKGCTNLEASILHPGDKNAVQHSEDADLIAFFYREGSKPHKNLPAILKEAARRKVPAIALVFSDSESRLVENSGLPCAGLVQAGSTDPAVFSQELRREYQRIQQELHDES